MRLDITYNMSFSVKKDEAEVAFIHSNDPRVWLTELSRWGSVAANWACYAMPESVRSVAVSGLFVVTEKPELSAISPHLLWFKRVGERLFIPTNAQLTPSVSDAELAKMLIFDVQFFHPTIGWVGFNGSDKLDLAQLLEKPIENATKWHYAKQGLSPRPPLTQIRIQPPQTHNLGEMLQKGLEQKPLKDIPLKDGSKSDEEKSAFDKMIDDIKEQLLRGGRATLERINDMLPENTTGQEGLLDKPYRWINERLSDLQQKRESELKRLLDMFENDPDEALKYALPLENPYSERGIASPSDSLGTRSTDFNLGNLGGGQAVDSWNTDNHYVDLRKKYLEAANKANENGDYRRAAYIYAHLLGDFSSAANVLEQGGFYREAAALYRDHLKNLAAAAICLEKGKLYLEAIELYQKLEQNEKVGDLYQFIGQPKNAAVYYEKCVENALNTKNYIEAARLENEKLRDTTRYKATLLRGWSSQEFTQAETCLRQYFDQLMFESAEEAAQQIAPIFKESPEQKLSFLGVLININFKYSNPDFQNAARPIAYQIVSEELVQGNRGVVNDLEHFFSDDALMGKDISLFLNRKPNKPPVPQPKKKRKFNIGEETKWYKTFSFHDGFVALGQSDFEGQDGYIDGIQSDWVGEKIDRLHEFIDIKNIENFGYATSFNYYTQNYILIWAKNVEYKGFFHTFDKNNKISTDSVVYAPVWIPEGTIAAGIYQNNSILILRESYGMLELLFYTLEGELLRSENCYENGEDFKVSHVYNYPITMLFSQKHCLYFNGDCLFFISLEGEVKSVFIGILIIKVVQSIFENNIFVLITVDGLLIFDSQNTDFKNKNIHDIACIFGRDIDVRDLLFVSATEFIALGKEEAVVFQRVGNTATRCFNVPLQPNGVGLLRTNEPRQFAVLYAHGLVEYYGWV